MRTRDIVVGVLVATAAWPLLAQDADSPVDETGTIPVSSEPEAPPPFDEPPVFETIEVTASKRTQAQRDIPGSIDVARGADLEKRRAQGLADYLKTIPGVTYIDRGNEGSIPVIRGITTTAGPIYTTVTQLPVGIYVDDMPFSDLYIPYSQPDLNPFDLERVEILKGPQGTLFGSGALAGAIRYVPQKPELAVWEAKVSETIRSTPFSDGLSPVTAAALNVPIGDTAAIRAVGVARRESGLIDEAERGSDVDRVRQDTGRALAQWNITDRLGLSGFYFRQESDQPNSSQADNAVTFDRALTGVVRYASGFSGGNLSARYAFDGTDLLVSSNMLDKDVLIPAKVPVGSGPPTGGSDTGGDNGPGSEDVGVTDALASLVSSQTRGLFQEIRLSSNEMSPFEPWDWLRADWLVGTAFQRNRQDVQQGADAAVIDDSTAATVDSLPVFPIGTAVGPIYGTRNASIAYVELHSTATEVAAFGETTARLGERWEATLGARGFWTTMEVKGFQADAQTIVLQGGETQADIDRVVRARGFNPRIALRYLHSGTLQLYGLASKGYQFGGIQVNAPSFVATTGVPEAFVPYKSSKLWNYEVGVRSEFVQQRLRLDATAFVLDWSDLQITVRKPIAPGSGLSIGFVENIGRARSQGVESRLAVTVREGLDYTVAASWMEAVTTEGFDSASGFVPAGTRLPGSPRFQWSNALTYVVPFSMLGAWEASATVVHAHVGSSYNDLHYSHQQGGYATLDLGAGLKSTAARLQPEITFSLLNATDVRGVTAVDGAAGQRDVGYYFTRPRTLLLSLGIKY